MHFVVNSCCRCRKPITGRRKEGNVLFNDALNIFYIYGGGGCVCVKDSLGRCTATTPSSFSLTSNRLILTYCPRHTAQLIIGPCANEQTIKNEIC